MRSRRLGAFLLGAWFLGAFLVWYTGVQSYRAARQLAAEPPPAIAKEIGAIGPAVTERLLHHQAATLQRDMQETWEIAQLGLLALLLAMSVFTDHRSRATIAAGCSMWILVGIQCFWVTPSLSEAGRALDFATAGSQVWQLQQQFNSWLAWRRAIEVLKVMLGFVIAARLLLDWRLIAGATPVGDKQSRRRKAPAEFSSHDTRTASR